MSKAPTNTAPREMNVPCGSCLGCRDDRSRHWAARIVHESTLHDYNRFITLTYRDPSVCTDEQYADGLYLPEDGSLDHSHFQKFMKRLRYHVRGITVRYYQVGEYGDENDRPHYHACLFGLRFPDEQLYRHNQGNPLFISQTLENLWGYGFATLGSLTYESAAYCSRYCFKKVTGSRADDHYLRYDERGKEYWLRPEYATMSRNPGIGAGWFEKYASDVFPSDETPIPGRGTVNGAPRYYTEILKHDNPLLHEQVKEGRKKFAEEHGDEYTLRRLEDKYKVRKASLQRLRREL